MGPNSSWSTKNDNIYEINEQETETETEEKQAEKPTWKKALIIGADICVGVVVDAVLKNLAPSGMKALTKMAYKIGSMVLSGAIAFWASRHVNSSIDEVQEAMETIKVKISEEPAEA